MATQRAAVLTTLGEPLHAEDIGVPPKAHGSAIVKVLAASVSPNAKAGLAGNLGFLLQTPVTPSSSCIARIKSVGPDATSLKGGRPACLCRFLEPVPRQPRRQYPPGLYGRQYGSRKGLVKLYVDLAYLGMVCVPLAGVLDMDVRPGDTVAVAPATGYYGGSAVLAALALGAYVTACGRNRDTFRASGRFSTVPCTGDVDKEAASILAVYTDPKCADALIDFSPPQSAGSKNPY